MSSRRNSPKRSLIFLPNSQTRLDLARRLHDGLAQELAVLGYALDEVIGQPQLSQEIRDSLRKIRIRFTETSRGFRDEIYRMRLMDRKALRVELIDLYSSLDNFDLTYPELSEEHEDAIAHSLLELARNCHKHSDEKECSISWSEQENALVIIFVDHGNGNIQAKERSFGLRGIQEWISNIGGEFAFRPTARGLTAEIVLSKVQILKRD